MKVALLFLICFVSLSYQQRWVSYPVSPAGYFYQGTNPYFRQSFNNFASYDLEDLDRDEGSDVEGRLPNKLSQSPFPRSFLFPSRLWSSWASSLLSFQQVSTSTSTVYTSVTSTTAVVAVQSCISSNAFASAAPGGFSTTPCVRRRRDVLEDLIEKPHITPSKVEPLVPTVLAVEQSDSIIPEIASSLSVPNEKMYESRRSRAVTVVVTTTSTLTSYAFSTTTVKKFFGLAVAPANPGAGPLLCLPNGYTPC